ncbi:hypothetical protein F5J12DRAFT_544673 [Pisolithus orientalis]|uniref:uncharacterized protein n=1 Tax=Pisolithus orientalis TaxID=936130 RepID=UPI00222592D2|nr:uncharacterized protein F5J12DRAFT_544673 [Pisolithus orientalis]KAI6012650.1 hypothetical protein F5J12DRAFT_544673 [Pisolithus orientalis]
MGGPRRYHPIFKYSKTKVCPLSSIVSWCITWGCVCPNLNGRPRRPAYCWSPLRGPCRSKVHLIAHFRTITHDPVPVAVGPSMRGALLSFLTFCSRSYIPLHYRLTRRVACAFYTGLPSYACQPNNVATEPFPSAYFVLVKIGGHARLNIINFSISPRILFCLTIILSLTGRGNHIWGVWINLCIFTVTYSIVFLLVAHHGMNS